MHLLIYTSTSMGVQFEEMMGLSHVLEHSREKKTPRYTTLLINILCAGLSTMNVNLNA